MLSAEHRNFLVVHQCLVPFAFNFALNALIVWLLFRTAANVPLWGSSSLGVDLLATAFLLPFLTCVIVSRVIAGQVRSHKVAPLPAHIRPLTRMAQRPSAVRGLALGAAGVLFGAAPIVVALTLAQAQPLAVADFVVFKGAWAALLAALTSPLIAWWALAHSSTSLEG